MGDQCRNCRGTRTVNVDVGGNAMRVPCYSCTPDPRDARIAELEAALAGLVDALPECEDCMKTARWGLNGGPDFVCDEHSRPIGKEYPHSVLDWATAVDDAERALGRRK